MNQESKDEMETEAIDKLFLELSQVTKARTKKEIELGRRLKSVHAIINSAIVTLEALGKQVTPSVIAIRELETLMRGAYRI
jgi:hypothetical protein